MQKRVLSIQDISCYGRCSQTIALPVLSAAGVECAILPTALLSTHTGGYAGFTKLNLTDEMRKILAHWRQLGLQFDAIYSGYLCSNEQMGIISEAIEWLLAPNGLVLVDPVMGDGGKLYTGFDDDFVRSMRNFAKQANIITPNITEATFLADITIEENYSMEFVRNLAIKLHQMTCKAVIITGVVLDGKIGVYGITADGKELCKMGTHQNAHIPGTGDAFASAMLSGIMQDLCTQEAAYRAMDFVHSATSNTTGRTDSSILKNTLSLHFESSLHIMMGESR